MKRIISVCLIAALVLVLAGCRRQEKAKEDIFTLIEENYDAIVKACENQDAEALLNIDGITDIKVVDGYVLVYCKGAGIAPSSHDYGFYYSEENLPVAVDCSLEILRNVDDLLPEGNGYQCVVDANVFYTERIKDNIYFYSASY